MDVLTALLGTSKRADPLLGEPWWYQFGYPVYGLNQTLHGDREQVPSSFGPYVEQAYKASGPVFACELVRIAVFSEARLVYRRLNAGRGEDLFVTSSLNLVRRPWRGATTGDLLARALLDADFGGNAFIVNLGSRLKLLRPDWVDIVLGADSSDVDPVLDPEADVVGYLYHPGGRGRSEPVAYLPDRVAHFAPIPDPVHRYRGMSWLTPVVSEVVGDKQATAHKAKVYEQGATPNMVVKGEWRDPDQLRKWAELFRSEHEGVANAYKTLILGSGMDATVVGNNFQQLDFKAVQGASETRIAAASGVGAVIAQLSEGLQGSSLNTGNYAAARRRVADGLFRPLWRQFCGSLEPIITVPRSCELWFDDRDIPFLQEDQKDLAEIQHTRAQAIRTLLDAGFAADTVVAAVDTDDFTVLEHSGLFSVQLQPPGEGESL